MLQKLTTGQQFRLTQLNEKPISRIRIGLGWSAAEKRGFFKHHVQEIDLDASALLFNSEKFLIDAVWFNQLTSQSGAVTHTGDDRTGEADGDDESIIVDFAAMPDEVTTIVFTVNSFTGLDFSRISSAYVRLVDDSNNSELARFELTDCGSHNARIMSKVARDDGDWIMTALGAPANGRTFNQLVPAIKPFL